MPFSTSSWWYTQWLTFHWALYAPSCSTNMWCKLCLCKLLVPKHTAYINTILAAALVSVLEHTLARARFLPCTGLAGDARCCIHHQDFARLHELQVHVLVGTGKCYRLQANVKSVDCLLLGNSRFLFPQKLPNCISWRVTARMQVSSWSGLLQR